MNRLVFVAPLLLAAAAYEKGADLLAPPVATLMIAPPAAASASSSPMGGKGTTGTADVAAVVTAADAFLATLTAAQKTAVVLTRTQDVADNWSNLPCGATCRNGLLLSSLTATQAAAALAVVQAATGTATNEGYSEALQIRAADDVLGSASSGGGGGGPGGGGGGGYSSGTYLIAFLGTPSLTGTWQLQFGGHHLAINTTYKNGAVAGATPLFEGVEPSSFTLTTAATIPAGTYAPLSSELAAMQAMLNSNNLTATQLATAKISQTFSDVLLGPNANGQFPATKVGLRVGALTAAQQAKVVAAMEPWVRDADDATAASLLAIYQNELANTYISYSGTTALTNQTDYVRIDGPSVWIELVGQAGVVYTGVHYHSIWRDHARDYGGDYYTTVTLGAKSATAAQTFSVYPNPADQGSSLHVQLAKTTSAARYTLRNALGQTIATQQFKGSGVDVPTSGLATGTYVLSLQVQGQAPVTHRFSVR